MEQKELELLSTRIGVSIKELNRLNKNKWYHGTTVADAQNIEETGVIANYNIGQQLDFGPGFYLTDTFEKAETYISRVPEIDSNGCAKKREEWAVIEFAFNPFDFLFENEENKYTFHNFPKHNEEFAKFVFYNRTKNVYNENPHDYDIIWGVMSDNFPDEIIRMYLNADISYEQAIKSLQKSNSMKQLYIKSQEICNLLEISNKEVVQ